MPLGLGLELRTYRYAKGRAWQQLVYAAAVAGFTTLAVSRTSATGNTSHASWLAVVVLVGLGLIAFRGIFDRRPALLISDGGVWFRGWDVNKPIRWRDVSDIRYVSVARGEPLIELEIRPDNVAPHGRSTYHFRTSMLDIRNKDAFALVSEYWRAASLKKQDAEA